MPVTLPPGRGKLATKPAPIGSITKLNTTGIVLVSRCIATVAGLVCVKIIPVLWQGVAPSLGVEPVPSYIENDASDIERAITIVASTPNTALVVLPESTTNVQSDLIIGLAARHRLPAVYTNGFTVAKGGLMSYGVVAVEQYRLAASYVDRILRGAKPGDLPVQTPTKCETVVNQKTAKALGLAIPAGLLVAADEVIE